MSFQVCLNLFLYSVQLQHLIQSFNIFAIQSRNFNIVYLMLEQGPVNYIEYEAFGIFFISSEHKVFEACISSRLSIAFTLLFQDFFLSFKAFQSILSVNISHVGMKTL